MTDKERSEMEQDMEQDKRFLVLAGKGVYCPACAHDGKQSLLRITFVDMIATDGNAFGTVECSVCHLTFRLEVCLE